MRHQVDIFQQQLQYEALAAATPPLMFQAAATTTLLLASHLQRDGGDSEGFVVTGAWPRGVTTFFLGGPELTGRSFATHCALKHKFH